MKAIFNGILEFENDEKLEEILNLMDKSLAIKLLTIALDLTTENFSLAENHVIYKCLTKLKQNEAKTDHLHNDDNNGDIG
jgi:hypothetical protein